MVNSFPVVEYHKVLILFVDCVRVVCKDWLFKVGMSSRW